MTLLHFQLIDVGRMKSNATIEVESIDDLPKVIKKTARIMSNDLEIWWDEQELEGQIMVGFCRPVGRLRNLDFPTERRGPAA